jgi:uncharacterized ferritin-like protein (DUF455 family)
MTTLRHEAVRILRIEDPAAKAAAARRLDDPPLPTGAEQPIEEPHGIPGRPARPQLVSPGALKQRSVASAEGRGALFHALAHIELNAIDLALDLLWRFPDLPDVFYREWASVARDEALHFQLLTGRLQSSGYAYGDFPAHNGLWDMAERTRHDLLARLALVPRTLEARGLDASPAIREKLLGVGDREGAQVLDVILRDEIVHVRFGNHWYRAICRERGLDPVATYAQLAHRYGAPLPRGPFNMEARRAAGFSEEELAALQADPTPRPARRT